MSAADRRFWAVRGAIQVDLDHPKTIAAGAIRLVREVLDRNKIDQQRIVSVVFSLTPDLRSANPATGIRLDGLDSVPLFCVQEAQVDGLMPRVIRLMVTFEEPREQPPTPVYLDGAQALRPDLSTDSTRSSAE